MASYSTRVKIYLISLFSLVSILIPITVQRSQSVLPRDPYWRYQGASLAKSISNTGHILQDPFPDHSFLITWGENFIFNSVSPVFITITSHITGIQIQTVLYLPLLAIPILVLQTVAVGKLVDKLIAVPIAAGIVLGYQFKILFLLTNPHRVSFSILFLFTLILLFSNIHTNTNNNYIFCFMIVAVVWTMSYTTMAVSMLIFFAVISLGVSLDGRSTISLFLFICSIVVFYYGIIFSWLITPIVGIAARSELIFQLGSGSIISTLQNVLFTTAGENRLLEPYKYNADVSFVYGISLSIAQIISITFAVGAYALRGLIVWRVKEAKIYDYVFVAIGIQAVSSLIILPFFAGSGGIDPLLLGVLFTPLFITVVLTNVRDVVGGGNYIDVAIVVVVLLACVIGFSVSLQQPTSERVEAQSISTSEFQLSQWSASYIDRRVISDFNSLSTIHTISPTQKSYLPPSGVGSSASERATQRLLDLYYKDPSSANKHAGAYVVSKQMLHDYMLHRGAVRTRPNPELSEELASDMTWQKIYSNGNNTAFLSK